MRSAFWRRRAARSDLLACGDAVRLMTDYLDGALSEADADWLAHHLARCPLCSEYLRQLRMTAELASAVEPPPDEATTESLAALYRAWRAEST